MRAIPTVLFLSSLSLIGPQSLPAQTPPPAIPVADPYALEPLVIEHSDTLYRMAADGTGFSQRSVVARIQGESTLKQLSVLSIPFASKSEHVEWIYARVRHADGSVTETPVTAAIEVVEPVTREAPFYSDLKQTQLPLRDLRVGDTLDWKAKIVRTSPEAPGHFWGQHVFYRDAVTLSETLELDVPTGAYVNVWSPLYQAAESTVGMQHIFRWQYQQSKPTVGPQADAFKETEKKRVRTADEELDLEQGKLPDIAWTTFKSWEDVGAWYRGMEGDRIAPDAEIKAKVAQITVGKTTQQEKVQAVYAYVATQIHYIGVAFGIGRYQPHSASDVLGNQYGDCKDKHTLLASMLTALGLNPDAVLIGAGIRFNPAVPSPSAFNHLITHVVVDGKPVWLDTTAEVAPYGMLLALTRDHDALVVPATGVARIEKTPARPPFPAVTTMDSVGALDADGKSTSRLTFTFHGDEEIVFRAVLRQVSPAQYDQLAQQICSSMGYAGTASHMEVGRIEDTAEPLKISFDYKREKAGDWANYRTIPQLSPVPLVRLDDKDPPIQAISLGSPRTEISHSAMKLPEGWGVEFPEAVHEKSAYATYDETYRFDKGTMYAERRIEILKDRIPVADWKTYSKFADKVDAGNESYIQLTRSSAAKTPSAASLRKRVDQPADQPDAGPPSPGENNASAQKLIQQASEALQAFNKDQAQTLLDQARAINDKQSGLWSSYGYLTFQRGDLPGAIKDYEKELGLHPANTFVYPFLVQAQLALKQKDEAMLNLHRWIQADPADYRPIGQLANMQLLEGKPAEAVETIQTSFAQLPAGETKNERLQLLLGRAQFKAARKEDGHATLAALLKSTADPGMMNDTAYELADAGLELPLAEQTARAALDRMEQQSLTWTLDENLAALRGKSQLLQATWDTMGWVYFRNGKIPQAEQYITAAWKGRQDGEVGRHLGEIAAAKGDKNAALTDYELAIATFRNYDALGVRTDPGAEQIDLQQRAQALYKQGAHPTSNDASVALQKLRTIPLGPAAGLQGVAEYKMLVAKDTVLRAAPTGEKTLPGAEDRLKKAKLTGFIPAGSDAQLVLTGMFNCHSNLCDLVLEP